ncbi:hypothetical protein M422DRAFT_208480 [Sphaerobolus stellatus SS14]|uniref:Phosducin domain-containing protein n=1 Tax=Sphaerobolus stellatus (strain SS14) TaxID=990650 RepID=A0A0C9VB11_SPHS4|nr:hypothetical protein M422DRAFT_208480 [Sphaerobolus stellatus SS14]
MNINPYEDTEFNDALRKHGIIPQLEPTPSTPSPPSSPKLQDILSKASESEWKELEDEANDSETERMIASYRTQRLAELREQTRNARFGEVYPIGRDDYTREVTEASKVDTPGEESKIKGTGVVCFLYKDGQVASIKLADQLKELARRHPQTKFVSIVGNKCIPNYADNLCPTLIIYRGGEVTRQTVAWGVDRERSIAELEAMLILSLAITSPPQPEDKSDDEISDDEDDREQRKPPKNIRSTVVNKADDSDSDFDL